MSYTWEGFSLVQLEYYPITLLKSAFPNLNSKTADWSCKLQGCGDLYLQVPGLILDRITRILSNKRTSKWKLPRWKMENKNWPTRALTQKFMKRNTQRARHGVRLMVDLKSDIYYLYPCHRNRYPSVLTGLTTVWRNVESCMCMMYPLWTTQPRTFRARVLSSFTCKRSNLCNV